jgi:hypothetical protein
LRKSAQSALVRCEKRRAGQERFRPAVARRRRFATTVRACAANRVARRAPSAPLRKSA